MAYLRTPPGVIKLVDLGMMVIVIALSFYGHFSSNARIKWDDPQSVAVICSNNSNTTKALRLKCPSDVMSMEKYVLSISIIFFIITKAGLVLSVWKDDELSPKVKLGDAFYHVLAGILLLSAGVMMVTSPIQIEEFEIAVDEEKMAADFDFQKYRGDYKFGEKIAAGVFAFITGILYNITGWAILKF